MQIVVLLTLLATALARYQYESIINDPLIEVELLRCQFETNKFTYKITSNQVAAQVLYVYGTGMHIIEKPDVLNYAVHTLAPFEFEYNVVETMDSTAIDVNYAVISVEDEAGNLIIRKAFDCDDVNPRFIDKPAYVTKVDYLPESIIVHIRNFWHEPKPAWIYLRQETTCCAEWCSNAPHKNFVMKEITLNAPTQKFEVSVGILDYCNEPVEFGFSTYRWYPSWCYDKYTEKTHIKLPCPDLSKVVKNNVTLKSLKSDISKVHDYPMMTCENGICTTNRTVTFKKQAGARAEIVYKNDQVFIERISAFKTWDDKMDKSLEFGVFMGWTLISVVMAIVVLSFVFLRTFDPEKLKKYTERFDNPKVVSHESERCTHNVKIEKNK